MINRKSQKDDQRVEHDSVVREKSKYRHTREEDVELVRAALNGSHHMMPAAAALDRLAKGDY